MLMNPHMLPKVRSDELKRSVKHMPCELRIGTFVGQPCSGPDTNVLCHLPVSRAKGMGTKESDIDGVCGCFACHELLDARNPMGLMIRERYPDAFWEQINRAKSATQARWVQMGLLVVPDGEIV